jgi:hypothetical protein
VIPLLDATRSKVEHALQRVRGLRSPAAAQRDVDNALSQIQDALLSHRDNLNALASNAPDPAVVGAHCRVTLGELYGFLSSLGFLHRAQHPCNPFEAYDPLRRLARAVIGSDTQIVISSEWDFSPHTIVSLHGLPDFVFVGLPASESDNAFLLPLAGHEFGHSLWRRNDEASKYEQAIMDELLKQVRARKAEFFSMFPHLNKDESTLATDSESIKAWLPAWNAAKRQCEEIFCDLVGLRLFGESYLKAFAWLIAPGLDMRRSVYPLASKRASVLVSASTAWGIAVPTGFEDQFRLASGTGLFHLDIADATSGSLASELTMGVDNLLTGKGISLPRLDIVNNVSDRLLHAAPSVIAATLQELLCGAWRLRDRPDLWSSYPHLARDRERILNDLLLKSAQCLEWRIRLEAA